MNHELKFFAGGSAVDDRGKLQYCNDFDMAEVRRFYVVSNHETRFVRAWHAHKQEAKFVYELKNQRSEIWNSIKSKKFHSNTFIKANKIHIGERGIYRDVNNTRKKSFTHGLAVSVLDTGKIYDDVLTESHLTYFYPETKQTTTDLGEINALKSTQKYNLPIFVVIG